MAVRPITQSDIIDKSYLYNQEHGVKESDVIKANRLRDALESSRRDDTPCEGDIMICRGPSGVVYEGGHVESSDLTTHSAICVRPSAPFVFEQEGGDPSCSVSGGYFFNVDKDTKPVLKGKAEKSFKAWGHCGACGNGAFYFPATVNVWEICSDSVY